MFLSVVGGLLALGAANQTKVVEGTSPSLPQTSVPSVGNVRSEPSMRAERTPPARYDKAKWDALLKYDANIAQIAEKLKPLGEKWVNEFGAAYLVLNDKQYLPAIVQKIIADARAESADADQRRALAMEAAKQPDLDALPDRRGPWEYKGVYYYDYPDGRVDGSTRLAGWYRFASLYDFQDYVDRSKQA